ncbi:SdrD B-like domain-containing protein [Actibacterium ureilyticum]|uniref:SdrD B-like domain-containing protein n=1 Tax=Actibacterium ureilyticum TaxID=1590614 RepID=UPI000BAA9AFC|nr:SdrD B-like domain-containing protein [Actibacterium ureilyticum]
MTYYSKNYYGGSYGGCNWQQKYEWSAFTEADLLKDGDGNLGCGDSFTMPAGATVCMSTYDDDSKLSGDEYCNENATDHSGQQAYVDGAKVGSQMYAESYHVLKGSDGKTYYLIEIEVEGHDAPGAGDDYFTFYGAVPPEGVELSVVQTCNVSGCWVDFRCLGAGECAPENEPPTFTNIPADGILCVDENTTFVIDLNAEDPDGDSLTYEIVGGADAGSFEIDPTTGELTFKGAPDYETPGSADGDNAYDVTVKVSDGKGGEEIKALKVNVCDVDEGGTGGECIVIEAEDMQLCGYTVQNNPDASGGQLVKGQIGCWASATTTFEGTGGEYDLKLSVLDENDGQGWIYIYVNGQPVAGPVRLDLDNGGDGGSPATFREIVVEDLQLNAGDVITIYGKGECGEFARLDKIELCKDGDPMTGAIGDTVWFDADKDGIQDADEAGVAGITVNLKDADGNVIATTETDANGNYLFENLAAGDYSVAVVPAGGLVFTTQDAGDDAADSDVDATTGMTGTITLAEGETNLTVDAGLIDPGTASLAGRYFCDENDNDVDDNEPGIANARVVLTTASGVFVAETFTDADGNYIFTGLDAGDYKVTFDESAAGGKVFIAQDVGSDDTVDSDVDPETGMTGTITLAIGDAVTDVDAGVETPNTDPDAQDDAGHICANEELVIDVLANDSDADGDTLTVTAVNGIAIADGETIDIDGVFVTLSGGALSFDAEDALVGLNLGEEQTITYSYTVEDGNGGSDVADIAATFCGTAETVDEICASLPTMIDYQIVTGIPDVSDPSTWTDIAYDIQFSGSGDARLDGLVFTETYCISQIEPVEAGADFGTAAVLTGNLYCADADTLPEGIFNADQIGANGLAAIENLDLINYILNQDYTENGYTGFEVQSAIWALTDDFEFEPFLDYYDQFGDAADVEAILADAYANGEGFEAGAGDVIGLIVDPNPATDDNSQPFIVGVEFDSLDCLC